MRISDWSSDVCSSDLFAVAQAAPVRRDDLTDIEQALRQIVEGCGRVEKAVAKQQQRLVPITPAADVIAQSADADEFGLTDGHGQAGAGEDDQYKSRAAANRLDRKSTRLNSSH